MLPKNRFPVYALYIDHKPAQVDINVHPTKQEIKFEDEKIVYAFVQAAVKHALAQFSIAPSLDFSLNADIQQMEAVARPVSDEKLDSITSSNLFKTFTQKNQAHKIEGSKTELKHWKDFYEPVGQALPSDLERTNQTSIASKEIDYSGYSLEKQGSKLRLLP